MNKYEINERVILDFKRNIKQQIVLDLEQPLKDFSILEYLLGNTNYPFLNSDYKHLQNLLPELDKNAIVFMQINSQQLINKAYVLSLLFVHVADDTIQNEWRNKYGAYFQTSPNDGTIISPNKLILFKKENCKLSELMLMSSNN